MQASKRSFLVRSSALALLLGSPRWPLAQDGQPRLVVFGDSNVDNGNLFRLSQGRANPPPAWQGRSCNGPVVAEYAAALLGLPLVDYAVGGATTGVESAYRLASPQPGYPSGTGLLGQIDAFERAGDGLAPQDRVLVWAASNDIRGANRQDRPALERRIQRACSNIEAALRQLHRLGARQIVVANRTPRPVLDGDDNLNGVELNAAIAPAVQRAGQELGIGLCLYDAYAAIQAMMTEPQRHGFTEGRALCVDLDICAWDNYGGGQPVASGYVLWDGAHKTTRTHCLMGQQLAQVFRAL